MAYRGRPSHDIQRSTSTWHIWVGLHIAYRGRPPTMEKGKYSGKAINRPGSNKINYNLDSGFPAAFYGVFNSIGIKPLNSVLRKIPSKFHQIFLSNPVE